MKTIVSKDGTTIAYDQLGTGPTLVLVGGALQHRAFDEDTARLADLLAPHFTTIHYDRRGRGDSGDTPPYAVAREIEDLEAVIDAVGPPAYVFGLSSGAALALEAALALGPKIAGLALYEAPFDAHPVARQTWKAFTVELRALLAADRRDEAVHQFLLLLGTPAEALDGLRDSPVWPLFVAVAPTLAYDVAILGDEADVPLERARQVRTPALLMAGGAESPYRGAMHATVAALAAGMPHAETRIIEGQDHFVAPDALAPVLIEFFGKLQGKETP